MNIQYGTHILADDARAHATGFRFGDSREVDVSSLVLSDTAWVAARGNAKITISFSVTVQFDTEAEASRYSVAWSSLLPGQDDLTITWPDVVSNGSAALQSVQTSQLGCTVVVAYSFIAPSLATTGNIANFVGE